MSLHEDHLVVAEVEDRGEHVRRVLRRPGELSAYARATRAGVSRRPSRSGSSPMATSISRTAASARSCRSRAGPRRTSTATRRRASSRVHLGVRRHLSAAPRVLRVGGRGHVRGTTWPFEAAFSAGVSTGGTLGDRSVVAGQPDLARLGRLTHRLEDLRELAPGSASPSRAVAQHEGVEHVAVLDAGSRTPRRARRPSARAPRRRRPRRRPRSSRARGPCRGPGRPRRVLPELDRAEPLAHAVLGDHLAGDLGGLLDVVGRPRSSGRGTRAPRPPARPSRTRAGRAARCGSWSTCPRSACTIV